MEKLKIRKDRTPAVLRKLAKAEPTRASRGACWRSPMRFGGMSRAEAAARAPAWTARRCGTG